MKTYSPILAILLAAVAGCARNDGSGPALVPVQGRVTLDGKPLAFKSIRFVPDQGTPGAGAGAVTKEDGSYSLLAMRPGATQDVSGVAPGWYLVAVTEPMFPPKAKEAQGAPTEPAVLIPVGDDTERKPSVIPVRYKTPETTTLRVEVPREGGDLDLKLTSKP